MRLLTYLVTGFLCTALQLATGNANSATNCETNPQQCADSIVELIKNDITSSRLSLPPGNNAVEKLQTLRELAPQHDYAINGNRYIANEYLKIAKKQFGQNNLAAAEKMALAGQSLDQGSIRIAEMLQIINHERQSATSSSVENTDVSAFSAQALKLVERIKLDINNSRLLRPKGNNAMNKVRELQGIAPSHDYAVNGQQYIAEAYLKLAREELENGDKNAARVLASRAQGLDHGSTAIAVFFYRIDYRWKFTKFHARC